MGLESEFVSAMGNHINHKGRKVDAKHANWSFAYTTLDIVGKVAWSSSSETS
jgi:hypothetical protein